MEQGRIMTSLDKPIRIIIFTPGELVMLLVPLIIGVILGGFLGMIISISGVVVRKVTRRMQKRYTKRFIQGVIYWQLPPSKTKGESRLPLSYVREYVG